nr:hypothetical protein [Streptomyces sp. TLI_235]
MAASQRLTEWPFIGKNAFGLWPFHLHALIRSTIRGADDQADDRWSQRDWRRATEQAFAGPGEQCTSSTVQDRMLLVGCLRQGLRLARDFRLNLGWLSEATWRYIGDSVWEPLTPPAPQDPDALALRTPADGVRPVGALSHRARQPASTVLARRTTSAAVF